MAKINLNYTFLNNLERLDKKVIDTIKSRIDETVTMDWVWNSDKNMLFSIEKSNISVMNDLNFDIARKVNRDEVFNSYLGKYIPSYYAILYVDKLTRGLVSEDASRKVKKNIRQVLRSYHYLMIQLAYKFMDGISSIRFLNEHHNTIMMSYDSTIIDGVFTLRKNIAEFVQLQDSKPFGILNMSQDMFNSMIEGRLKDKLNIINSGLNRELLYNIVSYATVKDFTEYASYTPEYVLKAIKHELTRVILYALEARAMWADFYRSSICDECGELYIAHASHDRCICDECTGMNPIIHSTDGTLSILKNSTV